MTEIREQTVRILILDDHALFRESVARLLGAEAGFEVVAHCGLIDEALDILDETAVDVVLLDVDLGRQNGMDFMRLARRRGFVGRVLVVTAGIQDRLAVELIQSGISGIFMKHKSAASLAQAIRDVIAGYVFLDQELLQKTLGNGGKPCGWEGQSVRLTERERHVLSGVLEGLANKQIAGRIGVSESSVKATLQQLFSKSGVRTRSQLVRIALEQYGDLL
jgi:DNA-binding NarL/FixJ family response regulator